jgi:RNA polymerase sigma factor (sigma-70 family)
MALERLEPRTREAFQLHVVEGKPVDEVAQRLGMTTNAVYIVRSRVLGRIRRIHGLLEELGEQLADEDLSR